MNDKCKGCKYENKCACYTCSRLERKDLFEPKEVEIVPQNAGELWEQENCKYFSYLKTNIGGNEELTMIASCGQHYLPSMIHNKNGWTRLFPPVEEDVERIEIEEVVWNYGGGGGNTWPVSHGDCNLKGFQWKDLFCKSPMKMILEIPKDKP